MPLVAQDSTSSNGTGSVRGANSTGRSIRTNPPGTQGANPSAVGDPRTQAPIYITGRVVMPDGNPPPDPVRVRRVCSGVVEQSEYTRPNGTFNFSLMGGTSPSISFDASVGSTSSDITNRANRLDAFGGLDMTRCTVNAALPGHIGTPIRLGRIRPMDDPDVGQIVLTRMEGVTGDSVSATSLQAPKKASQEFERAADEARSKQS